MISDERMEKALRFLAETDDDIANAEGDVLRAEKLVEMIKDKLYLAAEGSVADRKAKANVAAEVAPHEMAHIEALVKHRQLKSKRETEKLVIEVWRTFQANRRMGQ